MAYTLKKVANVPNITSIGPFGPNKLAIKQPSVSPPMYSGSKIANKTKISEILNWIFP